MTDTYQRLKESFKAYLDDSQDSNTLLLEAMPLVYNICCDDIWYSSEKEKQIFDSLRTMWDIAYNYGFHDAISELAPEKSLTYE